MEDGVEKRRYLHRPTQGGKYVAKNAQLLDTEDAPVEDPPSKDTSGAGDWGSGRGGRGSKNDRRGQVREHDDSSSGFQDHADNTKAPKEAKPFFDDDMEVQLYGREESTKAEMERDAFLLRLLEGRGSLRGPKYKDCAFIRRVWFPTRAQLDIGEGRKAEKAKRAPKGKHDWMNADWDDDTDEEEVARIQALSLVEDKDDEGDETEGDDVGQDEELRGIELPDVIELNPSQEKVVWRMVAPNPTGRTRATLVHGPPGTGKTSTIAAAVVVLAGVGEPPWIVAQSNVGIKNVAEKLQRVGFRDFVLLVSGDYFAYW